MESLCTFVTTFTLHNIHLIKVHTVVFILKFIQLYFQWVKTYIKDVKRDIRKLWGKEGKGIFR